MTVDQSMLLRIWMLSLVLGYIHSHAPFPCLFAFLPLSNQYYIILLWPILSPDSIRKVLYCILSALLGCSILRLVVLHGNPTSASNSPEHHIDLACQIINCILLTFSVLYFFKLGVFISKSLGVHDESTPYCITGLGPALVNHSSVYIPVISFYFSVYYLVVSFSFLVAFIIPAPLQ